MITRRQRIACIGFICIWGLIGTNFAESLNTDSDRLSGSEPAKTLTIVFGTADEFDPSNSMAFPEIESFSVSDPPPVSATFDDAGLQLETAAHPDDILSAEGALPLTETISDVSHSAADVDNQPEKTGNTPVPEPSAFILLALGLVGLLGIWKKR